MAKPTKIGQRGEHPVARNLKTKGFQVELSPGSLGASDLKASKPRKNWFVQVKTSQGPQPAWPSPREIARLKAAATKANATPVVAQVSGNNPPEYRSAKNRRRLDP
jgi:Holliday junction resolvase